MLLFIYSFIYLSINKEIYTQPFSVFIFPSLPLGSSVPLENPDFSNYPRAQYLMEYSQKIILHAGDALFIPEGW